MNEPCKRRLTLDEQIAHLNAKGVRFSIMDEAAARDYLATQNNYFRLAAYRKNYPKHPGGAQAGQYVRLEFAYLVELAALDRLLQDVILGMALDVERHARLEILRMVDTHDEDGYSIVRDFIASLDTRERRILDNEIARNRHNTYCGNMVRKYEGAFPVWVFVEVLSFGKLIELYRFTAERFADSHMQQGFYLLLMCKTLRNAAAHNSCILNDLSARDTRLRTNRQVSLALGAVPGLTKGVRIKKMKNERIQQLVTLFYTYQATRAQGASRALTQQKLALFVNRLNMHSAYFSGNDLLSSTFSFLLAIIDKWYDIR